MLATSWQAERYNVIVRPGHRACTLVELRVQIDQRFIDAVDRHGLALSQVLLRDVPATLLSLRAHRIVVTAAVLILTINVFTASVFCACFVAAYRQQWRDHGENWLTLAFGLIAAHGVLEFVQPFLATAEPTNFIVFITYLVAMTAMVTGLARRFAVAIPRALPLALIAIGLPIYLLLLGLDRHDPVRPLFYQAPFVAVQLVGCWIIWRARRTPIDTLLLAAFAISAGIFAGKPFLAHALGIGVNAQSFLDSEYGALSETFEAFFLISTGVLLAIAVASGLFVEITIRSDTDPLSGLLNLRGFEKSRDRVIARAVNSSDPIVLILADLDYFKTINDRFGHAVGDQVIVAFARVLRDCVETGDEALIGRLGGEEFGVFLSGTVIEGRIYGENACRRFAGLRFSDIAPHDAFTASFGIAELQRGESIPNLMRRADSALYSAKHNGRNRVWVASAASTMQDNDNWPLNPEPASGQA